MTGQDPVKSDGSKTVMMRDGEGMAISDTSLIELSEEDEHGSEPYG